jgi:hypothetical protein
MSQKLLSRTLLLGCILLGTVLALAATAANNGTAAAPSATIQTHLQPDLSLKTVFVAGTLQASDKAGAGIGLRTCRCSCGQPCKTSADCGGGVCAPGITCCNKSPQDSPWLNRSSSGKNAAPAIAVKCN